MPQNPYASNSVQEADSFAKVNVRREFLGMFMTAAVAIGLCLLAWVFLVSFLDRSSRGYEKSIWATTLWFSSMLCSGLVASSERSTRPVLACTTAFGLFGIVYMACEGPVFGNASQGGDPGMTHFVVWNLIGLPVGVFAATQLGSWLQRRRDASKQAGIADHEGLATDTVEAENSDARELSADTKTNVPLSQHHQ